MADQELIRGCSMSFSNYLVSNLVNDAEYLAPSFNSFYRSWILSTTAIESSSAGFEPSITMPPLFEKLFTDDRTGTMSYNDESGAVYAYNAVDLTFPAALADWPAIIYFCASSWYDYSGVSAAYAVGGPLDSPVNVGISESVVFLSTQLKIGIDCSWT